MSEWGEMRIGDYADTFAGGTPDRGDESLFGGSIPWIKSTEVNLGRIKETEEFLSEKGLQTSAAKWIPANSVLVAMYGATAAQIAYLEIEATANQAVLAICPREQLDSLFLYYALTSAKHRLLFLAQGSGQPNLNKQIVDRFEVPAPLPPQQRRIATILTTLDEVIEATEKLVEKHQQIKAGLMHDLFTRGLWTRPELARGDHKGTPAEATAQEGQLRPPPEEAPGLYQDSPLGLIPIAWETTTIGACLQGIDSGKSPECPEIPATSDQWGVLKVGAVHPDGFRAIENKVVLNAALRNPAFLVATGDLLISRANTFELVGLSCHVTTETGNLMLSDKTLRLRPSTTRMTTRFMFWTLQTNKSRRQIENSASGTSGSMKNISQNGIRGIACVRPGLDEQEKITERMDSLLSDINTQNTHLAKLRQQKQGLMHDLLTGRVRVDVPSSATVPAES